METPPVFSSQDIEAALAAVPEEQREAVTLRIWGGLGFSEIAQVTGVPVETATSRCRYGLAAMKKYFNLATP